MSKRILSLVMLTQVNGHALILLLMIKRSLYIVTGQGQWLLED